MSTSNGRFARSRGLQRYQLLAILAHACCLGEGHVETTGPSLRCLETAHQGPIGSGPCFLFGTRTQEAPQPCQAWGIRNPTRTVTNLALRGGKTAGDETPGAKAKRKAKEKSDKFREWLRSQQNAPAHDPSSLQTSSQKAHPASLSGTHQSHRSGAGLEVAVVIITAHPLTGVVLLSHAHRKASSVLSVGELALMFGPQALLRAGGARAGAAREGGKAGFVEVKRCSVVMSAGVSREEVARTAEVCVCVCVV